MNAPEPDREPTLRDVLAAIRAVAEAQEGLRLDFAGRAELDEARHTEVTQALEALGGLAHGQAAQIAAAREDVAEVKGEVRATEAAVTARIDAVAQVVRSVKADVAAHVDDRGVHHRHAA